MTLPLPSDATHVDGSNWSRIALPVVAARAASGSAATHLATLLPLDLGESESLAAIGPALYQRFGRLDILVGNAGMLGDLSPVAHADPAQWERVMRINLLANQRLLVSLDPLLRGSDAGRAIFVTSGAGSHPHPYWCPYAASKVRGEQLLEELGRTAGLRFVTCRFGTIYGVSPGMRFHTAVNKFCWQAAMRLPLTGTIEVTRRCPLVCQHCYNNLPMGDVAARAQEMSLDEHRRLLDELSAAGCLWLLYTGGEIFARRDFLDIYTEARRRGFLITLFTNGTLISEGVADHLARFRPFAIEITLYGRTRETYERLTGVRGSFDRCLRGIHLLRERELPLALKTVAVTTNRHELAEMQAFADERARDRHLEIGLKPADTLTHDERAFCLDEYFHAHGPRMIAPYRRYDELQRKRAQVGCTPSAFTTDEIRDLQRKLDLTVVYVTHDQQEALAVSDRVIVMYAGTVVEEGPAHVIFASPKHPYTVGLMHSVPQIGVFHIHRVLFDGIPNRFATNSDGSVSRNIFVQQF